MLEVSGEVDVHTAPELRAALERVDPARTISVDLQNVDFIDSTGLGVLVGTHRQVNDAGGHFELVAESERILKLLRISGLIDTLTVVPPTT